MVLDRGQGLETGVVALGRDLAERVRRLVRLDLLALREAGVARIGFRDANALEVRSQAGAIVPGLLNVETKECEFVGRVGMGAVPVAHPSHEVGVLSPLPDIDMLGDGLFGSPRAG